MIAFKCSQCGKATMMREQLAGKPVKCSACGTAVLVPGSAAPVASVAPVAARPAPVTVQPSPAVKRSTPARGVAPTQAEQPEASSTLSRIVWAGVKGIAMPFLFITVLLCDIGINALLGINRPSGRSSLLLNIFPDLAVLKLVFVTGLAILATVAGVAAGNAISGPKGPLIGAAVGYLLGSMGGSVIIELMKRPRPNTP